MIYTDEPLSPGWWLKRLMGQLIERRPRYDLLQSYYDGTNGIPAYADAAVRDAARRLMAMSGTNYAELAIEATRERMRPIGFRTGAQNDDLGDSEAWNVWQANSLDADHKLVDSTVLSLSQAYTIVGAMDPDIGAPLITAEDDDLEAAVLDAVLAHGLFEILEEVRAEDVAGVPEGAGGCATLGATKICAASTASKWYCCPQYSQPTSISLRSARILSASSTPRLRSMFATRSRLQVQAKRGPLAPCCWPPRRKRRPAPSRSIPRWKRTKSPITWRRRKRTSRM